MEYNECKLKINYQMEERPELNTDLNITWILQLLSLLDADMLKYNEGKSA